MKYLLAAVLCLAALFISGCGGSSALEDTSKIKVGIVFDIGGKDDRSFNAAAWEGVQRAAKDLPIILRDIEPGTPNAIEPAMRAFAERHFDLIIGVGFAQAPIMDLVAKDYPNIQFAIIDGDSKLPNVASLQFKEHEGSYLVGILAAKASKSGTIGFLGGMDIGLIHRFARHRAGYAERDRARDARLCRTQFRSDYRCRFRAGPDHGACRQRLSAHPVCNHRRRQQVTKRRLFNLQRAGRLVSRRHTRGEGFEDRHDRFSRRHGHRSDSSFRKRLRGRREIG